jgi:hypothetical protein
MSFSSMSWLVYPRKTHWVVLSAGPGEPWETQHIAMSPVGLGNKNHCADEGQQQFINQAVSAGLDTQPYEASHLFKVHPVNSLQGSKICLL